MSFGIPLELCVRNAALDSGIPLILWLCVKAVEKNGLQKEGLYRISGRQTDVFDLKMNLETDAYKVCLDDHDIPVVAAIVKMYLRELPEPLFMFSYKSRQEYSGF